MLKKVLTSIAIVVVLLVVVLSGLFWRLAVNSRSMEVASGYDNGQLLPCPDTPNCVSSQAPETDSHYIPPIGDPIGNTWNSLAEIMESMDGVTRISVEDNYSYYTVQTPLLGFTDDVEFLNVPEQGLIHVRSASRVGRSDLNANRERLERIRVRLL